MHHQRHVLGEWRARLKASEVGIPWPGPRPLQRGEHLVGRDDEIDNFVDLLDFHSLVVLAAESGAGKTSFLNAGLRPSLEAMDWKPIVCSKWRPPGETTSPTNLDALILRAFEIDCLKTVKADRDRGVDNVRDRELATAAREHSASTGPLSTFLKDHFPRAAVIILDQFEELIRLNRPAFEKSVDWIHEITTNHDIRVVVSLRVEYLHELRGLAKVMAPYSYKQVDLQPVSDPTFVSQLIFKDRNNRDIQAATQELEAEILEAWPKPASSQPAAESAPNASTDASAVPGAGLLGVQALLYTLWWRMYRSGKTRIDAEVLERFRAELRGRGLFEAAMHEAANMKIESCIKALAASGDEWIDPFLAVGTAELVREISGHLDSGGFKLHREVRDLAEKSLQRELGALGFASKSGEPFVAGVFAKLVRLSRVFEDDDDKADTVADNRKENASGIEGEDSTPGTKAVDLLSVPCWELAELLGLDFIDGQPWDTDRSEVTSGPMLGLPRVLALLEELRRFLFAIAWLEASDLIRITGTSKEQEWVVSLIHDGFGPALASWADSHRHGPLSELTRLTGSRGEVFEWDEPGPDDPTVWPELDGGTVANIRWRDCEIPSLHLRNTRFINCDFRGSRFKACRLDAVQFVNCLLDNVTFDQCTVVGSAAKYSGYLRDQERPDANLAPSFELEATPRVVGREQRDVLAGLSTSVGGAIAAAQLYRGDHGDGSSLVSHTSGMPAVPMSSEHRKLFPTTQIVGRPWLAPIPLETGGLSMLGGRLCSLMFRETNFEADGDDRAEVGFRLVTGTALDIVEHGDGRFKLSLVGSAVRGLTVTGHHGDSDEADVEIVVNDCLLTEAWLGENLTGSAKLANSRVWHFTNLSTLRAEKPRPWRVAVSGCGYAHLVNVDEEFIQVSGPDDMFASMQDEDQRARVARFCNRMDYQSSPAEAEYERRTKIEGDVEDSDDVVGPMTWPAWSVRTTQ